MPKRCASAADQYKGRFENAVIVLGSAADGKVMLVASVTPAISKTVQRGPADLARLRADGRRPRRRTAGFRSGGRERPVEARRGPRARCLNSSPQSSEEPDPEIPVGGCVGVFALPLLVLLAQAEPPPSLAQDVSGADVRPADPYQARGLRPRRRQSADEPRFVAPTRRDRIGRIWAPVAVNGKGPYRLVLATGASHSALTPRLAEALGIQADPADTIMLRGATGSVTVPMVPIDTLEIGDLLMEPGQLAIIPDALAGADGVLGMEELANKRIHIDFRHDRITIMRSRNQRAAGGFVTIPVKFLHDRLLVVDASMGGVPVKAIIDTGGETTLGNVALRLALAERRQNQVPGRQARPDHRVDTRHAGWHSPGNAHSLLGNDHGAKFFDDLRGLRDIQALEVDGRAGHADRHGRARAPRHADHRLPAQGTAGEAAPELVVRGRQSEVKWGSSRCLS